MSGAENVNLNYIIYSKAFASITWVVSNAGCLSKGKLELDGTSKRAVHALHAVAPGVLRFIPVGGSIEYTLLYVQLSLQPLVVTGICILLLEN